MRMWARHLSGSCPRTATSARIVGCRSCSSAPIPPAGGERRAHGRAEPSRGRVRPIDWKVLRPMDERLAPVSARKRFRSTDEPVVAADEAVVSDGGNDGEGSITPRSPSVPAPLRSSAARSSRSSGRRRAHDRNEGPARSSRAPTTRGGAAPPPRSAARGARAVTCLARTRERPAARTGPPNRSRAARERSRSCRTRSRTRRLAVSLGEIAEDARARAEQGGLNVRLGRVDLVRQALVRGEFADHGEDERSVGECRGPNGMSRIAARAIRWRDRCWRERHGGPHTATGARIAGCGSYPSMATSS